MNNPKPKEWTSEQYSKGKIASYKPYNFVDGEGVRCSLYVSGCLFACEGCYNVIAQNFNYGIPYTKELEEQIVSDVGASLNTGGCLSLVKALREAYGHTTDIWSWTGYTWEELMQETEDKLELLSLIDILVDGRFELARKDLTLQFRGSSNQRIIDVQSSLKAGEVILWSGLWNSSNF